MTHSVSIRSLNRQDASSNTSGLVDGNPVRALGKHGAEHVPGNTDDGSGSCHLSWVGCVIGCDSQLEKKSKKL